MKGSYKVHRGSDTVIFGSRNYLVLIKLDFARVANNGYVSSMNANDSIRSNASFVSFAEESNQVANFIHEVCISWIA